MKKLSTMVLNIFKSRPFTATHKNAGGSLNYKDHQWSNATGTISGDSALLRRNESLINFAHSNYPYTLIVSLIFSEIAESGIPSNTSEISRADATEESIADTLFEKFGGLFSLSITTRGARDLFIMFNAPLDVRLIEQAIESVKPKIEYGLQFVQDSKWQPYFRFF